MTGVHPVTTHHPPTPPVAASSGQSHAHLWSFSGASVFCPPRPGESASCGSDWQAGTGVGGCLSVTVYMSVCLSVVCLCVCICGVCVWMCAHEGRCLGRTEEVMDSLEMELQTVARYGSQAQGIEPRSSVCP